VVAGSVFQGRGCYATAPASEGSADATWTEIAIWVALRYSKLRAYHSVSSLRLGSSSVGGLPVHGGVSLSESESSRLRPRASGARAGGYLQKNLFSRF